MFWFGLWYVISANSLKQGLIAIQGVTTGEELSLGMAFMVFTQSLFPAIALSLCNLVLVSSLKTEVPLNAPNTNTTAIIQAGATSFRSIVDTADLDHVIRAYATSVDHVFYLVAALAAVSGLFIWGMGWQELAKAPPRNRVRPESGRIVCTRRSRSQPKSNK